MSVDLVTVECTDRGAIIVDGTRITNRSTKWGWHNFLIVFACPKDQVARECIARGYEDWVRHIDTEGYGMIKIDGKWKLNEA